MKVIIINFLVVTSLLGAFEQTQMNAFTSGVSNSTIASSKTTLGFVLNPSINSGGNGWDIGLSYTIPYNISTIGNGIIIGTLPTAKFNLGFSIYNLRSPIYGENRITVNLSRGWFKNVFAAGLNIHWYSVWAKNYNSINSIGIDIGTYYALSKIIKMGFSILNVNQPRLNGYNNEVPIISNLGLKINLKNLFDLYLVLQKDIKYPTNFQLGLNYDASQKFSVQTGFSSYPAAPSIGIQLKNNWIFIYYSLRYHMELGPIHGWGIEFKKQK